MEPRLLLGKLMERDGDNPSSLARKLDNAVRQPQIHKFLRGAAREPRRATLAPLAAHYDVPLDAFYDPDLADEVARRKGLISETTPHVSEPAPAAPTPISRQPLFKWPLQVSYARLCALPAEARADIDTHLEILVEKWERMAAGKKSHKQN